MTGLTPPAQRSPAQEGLWQHYGMSARPRAAKGVQLFLWMGGKL